MVYTTRNSLLRTRDVQLPSSKNEHNHLSVHPMLIIRFPCAIVRYFLFLDGLTQRLPESGLF
jgi:hypothetical protein